MRVLQLKRVAGIYEIRMGRLMRQEGQLRVMKKYYGPK